MFRPTLLHRIALALLLGLWISDPLLASEQVRVSEADGLGNRSGMSLEPSLAYNPDRDEVLAVWFGYDSDLDGTAGRLLISARRLDPTSGEPLGPTFRIDDNSVGIGASLPHVVYNPIEQEYLVAWTIEFVATHYELFVQRLDAASLQPILAQPRQVTELGGPGGINDSAWTSALAFNPERNEYLLAFVGSDSRLGMSDLQRDVFIQRLDGATALEIGPDDLRISSAASTDESRGVDVASGVDVVYSPLNNHYLVVWSADDAGAGLADEEYEIFGQLIDGGTGLEIGTDDARLTTVGPAGNAFFDAEQPSVAFVDSNFVVAYRADHVQGFKEIFGVRVGGATALPFGGQHRLTISSGGAASRPAILWQQESAEIVIAYQSREVLGSAPVFENEVFLQRASEILVPHGARERWSALGPDGDPDFGPAERHAIVQVGRGSGRGVFAAWSGDHDEDGQIEGEMEAFARSTATDQLFGDGFEAPEGNG